MTAKKTLIAANWKMHKTVPEAVAFVAELQDLVGAPGDREVVITPAFTALWPLREAMRAAASNTSPSSKSRPATLFSA